MGKSWIGTRPRSSAADRFWAKVQKTEGCWLWTGGLYASGYGKLGMPRQTVRAHRFSYELHHGEIPAGLRVLHRCDVRRCVNPAHLFLGTAADNTADMLAKGREGNTLAKQNAAKTHCKRDHELAGHNLIVAPNGARGCRICRNEASRLRMQRVRQRRHDDQA